MNLLIEYTIALTNLYGLVHKDLLKDIYNSQNDDQASNSNIEELLINPPKKLENAFIYPYKEYFVHEAVLINDEVNLLISKKGSKPYYIPNKIELLKYVDEIYFEKTKAYKKLIVYLKRNFFKGEEEKAEWLCEEIHDLSKLGFPARTLLESFNQFNIDFKDINQVNEVMQMVIEFSNNTRIWENNGYTPNELFEKYSKPNLKPLPEKPFGNNTDTHTFNKEKKVGRNDPCPCGSGKKYKKCCLK